MIAFTYSTKKNLLAMLQFAISMVVMAFFAIFILRYLPLDETSDAKKMREAAMAKWNGWEAWRKDNCTIAGETVGARVRAGKLTQEQSFVKYACKDGLTYEIAEDTIANAKACAISNNHCRYYPITPSMWNAQQ